MSEVRVGMCDPEGRINDEQDGPFPDPVKSQSTREPRPDLQGLLSAGHSSSADGSPSPSAEASGLLSLPWEIVTHIASYLPAQCVINVLPKVCHTLGHVSKDITTWQLRARRLIGSKATFPVGPREDFGWTTACMEMEELITCWTDEAHRVARQIQEDQQEREEARLQQRVGQNGEPVVEGQQDGEEDEVEGVGVAGQEVPYGVDEEVEVAVEGEDGEMQPNLVEDQLVRWRDELEEQLEGVAPALIDEEMAHRMALGADDGDNAILNHPEPLADPRNLGLERHIEIVQRQFLRSPSPPPALKRITLPSEESINTVLLLGGEATICATGSRDYYVKLWDLQTDFTGTVLHTLKGRGNFSTHRGWVWCLASQGPLLASGGFDSTVRLWDLQAGGAERGLIQTGAAVLSMSYQTDVLLAGTLDKKINMYDTRAAEPLVKSLCLHGGPVMCLAADDRYIISGSQDGTVAIYDRTAGKGLKKLRMGSYLMSMSYSDCEVWAGDNTGMLHSFSMQSGALKPLSKFDVGHTALITGIHKSPGCLYTCSSDRTVKVHLPCGPPRTIFTLNCLSVAHGLSVKAGVLAVARGDAEVEIWRPMK